MSTELTDIEQRRYKRQINLDEIGIEGQLKLKQSKVLVIGAGGLGTPVLQYLAAAGVGTLGICDNDYVNESNFHRQIMYGASDLGKLKTIVAKEKLKLLNPLVEYNIHNIYINAENAENIIGNYHLVVDCSDNLESRKIVIETCNLLKKQVVIGLVTKFTGKVMVIEPNTIPPMEEFTKNEKLPKEKQEFGILGVIAGIIGSIQASEAIKILLNAGETLNSKILTFDALNMKVDIKS